MEINSLCWFCARVLDIMGRCIITMVLSCTVLMSAIICIPLYCLVLRFSGLKPIQLQGFVQFLARIIIHACGQKLEIRGEYPDLEAGPFLYVLLPHTSLLDAIILGAALKGHFTAVMAREYLGLWFWGTMMRLHDVEPIDRGNRETAVARLNAAAKRAFEKGRSLAMFIESTRSRDGKFGEFKSGPGHVAQSNRVPVVLVAIHGAFDALNRTHLEIKPGTITVTFGRIIDPDEFDGLSSDAFKALVRTEVQELLPQ